MGEEFSDNRVGVLPNIRLSDDVWIWEGSIIYQVLYLMLKEEAIVTLMDRFLMEVTIFIQVPSKGTRLGIGVRSKGLRNPLKVKILYS